MADILKGNWVTHDKPVQAKTNIRIKAHNAEANLSNLLSVKIDLTDETPASNAKIKGSKIFSDTGAVALFTPDGDIEEAVKVKGYTNTLKQVLTLGTDKAKSQCQLYIDSDDCLAEDCKFSVTRVMFRMDEISGDLVNPFATSTDDSIQIGDTVFSETDLSDLFDNVATKYSVSLSNHKAYTFLFCKELCSFLEETSSYIANQAEGFSVETDTFYYGYIYVDDKATVTVTNTSVFYSISDSYSNICVHIAGVSGLCAGKKVDTGLPPSNIYKTSSVPDMLFNCNPFDCRQDYILGGSNKISACIAGCPFGAIKHKQTQTTSLPVDTDANQLKIISSLKMIEKPYEE